MSSLIGRMKQLVKQGVTAEREDANIATISAGLFREVAVNFQQVNYGSLVVNGSMDVNGILIVDTLPT